MVSENVVQLRIITTILKEKKKLPTYWKNYAKKVDCMTLHFKSVTHNTV